jgi:hypothetical protein
MFFFLCWSPDLYNNVVSFYIYVFCAMITVLAFVSNYFSYR